MGYELHIVRRSDLNNVEEESNISLAEWKIMIESDDDLTWKQYPNQETSADHAYCYWLKHPEQDETNRPWFHFSHGMISTKWADFACMKKLVQMSEVLNARVEGDEGEVYTYDYILQLVNRTLPQAAMEKKKPFWKFW